MNWKLIIQELCSEGLTQVQIAQEVGVKQSTIAGILAGAQRDLRWTYGEKLRRLHRRVVGRCKRVIPAPPAAQQEVG
ncbi:helix-turn-helix domain-containing protein [Bordetella avium]|uniref:helix-turn-helix domain-containing protein n=1 Tax=Bordetella avium TaxID=521 RepID=UPI000E6897C4|nr:helix-turn-helix domain-containing protein [Bordetella avium]RIQ16069.1 helix-turn-helix domain-containing protein [Bordetella avium]